MSVKMENYAAVLHGPYDIRIEKRPIPEINENEVLIKMDCVGICGSDLKMYSTGKVGFEVIDEPIVMGHEGAGVVVKVGTEVKNVKAGDRVAIEPTQPCRACAHCKRGRYNLCGRPNYCSSMGTAGNLTHYYKHAADFCYKIPDNLSLEEGAAVQPLAIAIHACNRARVKLGDTLLVLGAGPIGVLCAMAAKAMGASTILITDVVQSRLDVAKKIGADYSLLVTGLSDSQIVDQVEKILGCQPDITIDACAYPSAQRVALKVTRSGGLVLVVGISEGTVELPLSEALLREVDIVGSFRMTNTYPAALAAVSSGKIDLRSFITHRFPLHKTKEAFELAKTGAAMKIILYLNDTY